MIGRKTQCYCGFWATTIVADKEEGGGKEEDDDGKKKKQVGGGMSVELCGTITMSSKLTQTSPEPAKLDKIGRFMRFVITLG